MKKNDNLEFKCLLCEGTIRPLTFFDGSVWCPQCGKELFAELKARSAQADHASDADDSFSLSQELFARYLDESYSPKIRAAALRNAIYYCRKAAYGCDPYALLNLGYYYGLGYDDSVHMETGRSFAKLCFDLARDHAPSDDQDFLDLVNNNERALKAPIEKSTLNDKEYLTHLLGRMDSADPFTAPRLGVFCIDKSSLTCFQGRPDGEDTVLSSLKRLFVKADLWMLKFTDPWFVAIDNENMIKNCFNRGDRVWFFYCRKGVPIGRFKNRIVVSLRNETEWKQNIPRIRDLAESRGNRNADFSDQDLVICSFIKKHEEESQSYDRRSDDKVDSALDCLKNAYEKRA